MPSFFIIEPSFYFANLRFKLDIMLTDSTYFTIVTVWIFIALIIFPINLLIIAPYGRHTKTTWGPLISNRIGWILMELPALLAFPLFFLFGTGDKVGIAWVFFSLWLLHYFNRTLVFPFRQKTTGKKMPMLIILMGIFFNFGNGFFNGWFQGNIASYPDSWVSSPQFIVGIVIFMLGMCINWQSDHILLNLRKPNEVDYKIPHGGLFKYVSCPNHLGEMVEWIGFALMTYSIAGLSFAIWTAANLIPRALAHHKWYNQNFSDYPKDRKAVIPGVL